MSVEVQLHIDILILYGDHDCLSGGAFESFTRMKKSYSLANEGSSTDIILLESVNPGTGVAVFPLVK